jgi:hypothetical protein
MQWDIQNDRTLAEAIEMDCCFLRPSPEVVEMAQSCFELTDDLIIAYAMDSDELFSEVYLRLQQETAELNRLHNPDSPFICIPQDRSGADWIRSVYALRLQLRDCLCF